jgi:hypothetical protein
LAQEHASGNPGLQTFLDKKGDEHVFSLLYLAAGVFCLYASFVHGAGFCTAPSVTLQVGAGALGAVPPPLGRRLLTDPSDFLTGYFGGKDVKASATGAAEIKTQPVTGKGPMLQEGGNATAADSASAEVSGDGAADGGASAAEGGAEKHYWGGSGEWVVRWLTVEGFTAVGLPIVSILMLLVGLHENAGVSCLLYLVAIFQALWLVLGCFWAFGDVVPPACRDQFAFAVMWWVCAVWLGSMVTISIVICCIICCFMGAAASASQSPARTDYKKVSANDGAGQGASGDKV